MPNFIVKAQWISDSNGKVKKHTELYLVDAVSVTDAESATVAEFGQDVSEFEVKEVKATKIVAAI
jgi:hypothetical protein|tara:strand:- start:2918 stop:3112 length:195 start_codon:yes stop_codon:yes gene_type:complete